MAAGTSAPRLAPLLPWVRWRLGRPGEGRGSRPWPAGGRLRPVVSSRRRSELAPPRWSAAGALPAPLRARSPLPRAPPGLTPPPLREGHAGLRPAHAPGSWEPPGSVSPGPLLPRWGWGCPAPPSRGLLTPWWVLGLGLLPILGLHTVLVGKRWVMGLGPIPLLGPHPARGGKEWVWGLVSHPCPKAASCPGEGRSGC